MWENIDQENSKYGHFLLSVTQEYLFKQKWYGWSFYHCLSLFINTPILICLKLPFRQNNVKNNNNSNNPIIIITAIAFELSSISIEVERGYSSQTFQLHLLGANISTKLLLTIIIYRCRKYLPSILLFIANNPYLPPVKIFTVHGKTCRE